MSGGIWRPGFKRLPIAVAVALSGLIGLTAMSEAALAQPSRPKQLASSKIKKHHAQRHAHKKVAHRSHEDTRAARVDSDDAPPPVKQEDVVATLPAAMATGKPATHDTLPAIVANAHAELTTGIAPATPDPNLQTWPSNDTLTADDRAVSPDMSPTGVQIATANQLNDIDREMNAQTNTQAADPVPAVAATIPFAAVSAQAQVQEQTRDTQTLGAETTGLAQIAATARGTPSDSPWSTASLIGKIFIGFGSLLTLASAARLIIA